MNRVEIVNEIERTGIVAVLRLNGDQKLAKIIEALALGGIKAMEITMTTPNAIEIIKNISKETGNDFFVGAGTVLNAEVTRAVIEAGARFVVSPILNAEVIKTAQAHETPVFPGAFTATEIHSAWQQGADVVKVFPATALGPRFFKDIHGPLPDIKLTPTGGVALDNAAEFIRNGACCLGVGTSLLNKQLIAENNWAGLTQLAKEFVNQVRIGRSQN